MKVFNFFDQTFFSSPYSQIVEIMYQKLGKPSDDEESNEKYEQNTRQLFATIEYALQAKELTNLQKLSFVKRKLELTQEFGNIRQFREVSVQLKSFKALCAVELRVSEFKMHLFWNGIRNCKPEI